MRALTAEGQRFEMQAVMIGVSTDEGETWKYVNLSSALRPVLGQMLPDFPFDQLELPPEAMPKPI